MNSDLDTTIVTSASFKITANNTRSNFTKSENETNSDIVIEEEIEVDSGKEDDFNGIHLSEFL